MEPYQAAVIAIALANLAVTVWLLRLLIPVWRELRQIVFALDNYDFDKLAKQFLNGEKPLAETIHIKTMENKEEGYKEIIVTRSYKKPLDPREIQENFVRQMAEKLQ
jgi:predicted PurR-regulated permease PerM